MTENRVPPATSGAGNVAQRERGPGAQTIAPPPPTAGAHRSGWSAGRITALVIGSVLGLVSIGLLGAGGTALWADLTQRDAAGYVTTGIHGFSTEGSALTTAPAELDSPGVGWLYPSVVLGNVRIRVTPVNGSTSVFVGIASSSDVDRFLADVSHTVISDFWTEGSQSVAGGAPGSDPGAQGFWVASASGVGTQTLNWDPQSGSWSVVVMNPDGRPGVDVVADLGATYPALLGIAIASLALGVILLVVGVLLVGSAIRRSRRAGTV